MWKTMWMPQRPTVSFHKRSMSLTPTTQNDFGDENLWCFFSDWWWLEHGNMAVIFPFHIWDVILPNWRNESFFRGVGIPPTRWLLTIINHIITIIINHYYGRYTTTNQALATVIPTEATQQIPRIRRPTHMRRRKKKRSRIPTDAVECPFT